MASVNHQIARPPRRILIDAPFSSRLSRYTQIITRDSIDAGRLVSPFKLDVTTDYGLWFVTSIAHENDRKILVFKRWLKRKMSEDFGSHDNSGAPK